MKIADGNLIEILNEAAEGINNWEDGDTNFQKWMSDNNIVPGDLFTAEAGRKENLWGDRFRYHYSLLMLDSIPLQVELELLIYPFKKGESEDRKTERRAFGEFIGEVEETIRLYTPPNHYIPSEYVSDNMRKILDETRKNDSVKYILKKKFKSCEKKLMYYCKTFLWKEDKSDSLAEQVKHKREECLKYWGCVED